jgi:hypothetical protein
MGHLGDVLGCVLRKAPVPPWLETTMLVSTIRMLRLVIEITDRLLEA